MREAIIKLILKWAYRCEHNWVKETIVDVWAHNIDSKHPIETRIIYRCTKCCKSKKITT